MTLQKIKSINGKDEYVLLPMPVYHALKEQIEHELAAYEIGQDDDQKYVPFILDDYAGNPVAVTRIKAGFTRKSLPKSWVSDRLISVRLNAEYM